MYSQLYVELQVPTINARTLPLHTRVRLGVDCLLLFVSHFSNLSLSYKTKINNLSNLLSTKCWTWTNIYNNFLDT